MAATFIAINRNVRLGGIIGTLIDQGKSVSAQFMMHWATIQTMVDNPATPTNFSVLEAQYGLPPGSGPQFYSAIKQAVTDFSTSQAVGLLTQIG